MDDKTPLGPNVKRLICEYAATLQIASVKKQYGSAGVGEVAASIVESNGSIIKRSMRESFEFVKKTLAVARAAPGSSQWPARANMLEC